MAELIRAMEKDKAEKEAEVLRAAARADAGLEAFFLWQLYQQEVQS